MTCKVRIAIASRFTSTLPTANVSEGNTSVGGCSDPDSQCVSQLGQDAHGTEALQRALISQSIWRHQPPAGENLQVWKDSMSGNAQDPVRPRIPSKGLLQL